MHTVVIELTHFGRSDRRRCRGVVLHLLATVAGVAKSVSVMAGRHPIGACLSAYRFGTGDPTTRLAPGEFWRASFTPDGPATIRIRWNPADRQGELAGVDAWGPGREWMLQRAVAMTGGLDPGFTLRRRASCRAARPAEPPRRPVRRQPDAVPRAGADHPRPTDHRRRSDSAVASSVPTARRAGTGSCHRIAPAAATGSSRRPSRRGGSILSGSRPSAPRRCEQSPSTPTSSGVGPRSAPAS